jgi:hypothetical protein
MTTAKPHPGSCQSSRETLHLTRKSFLLSRARKVRRKAGAYASREEA